MVYYFLFITLTNILSHVFSFSWIGELVNSWFRFFLCHLQVKHHMFSRILNLRIQILCFLKNFFVFFFDEEEVFDWDQNRPKMMIKLFIFKIFFGSKHHLILERKISFFKSSFEHILTFKHLYFHEIILPTISPIFEFSVSKQILNTRM